MEDRDTPRELRLLLGDESSEPVALSSAMRCDHGAIVLPECEVLRARAGDNHVFTFFPLLELFLIFAEG